MGSLIAVMAMLALLLPNQDLLGAAGRRRNAGGFCATDPLGDNWDHLTVVMNAETCSSPPCSVTYNLHSTKEFMVSGGDSSWTVTGGSSNTAASKANGQSGFDTGTSGGTDNFQANTGVNNMVPLAAGRIGFFLEVTPGGTCAANNTVGVWTDQGAFSIWTNLIGDADEGWDLRVLYDEGANTRIATFSNGLTEGTRAFVELEYSNSANRLNVWINGISGTARETDLIDMQTSNRMRIGNLSNDCQVQVDDLWVSTNSTWDIFNYVSGGDDSIGEANDCSENPK